MWNIEKRGGNQDGDQILKIKKTKLINIIKEELNNINESLTEKAKSKAQQRFMGMVHAMQKGEKIKGASPELKKVARTMKKSDAKDFAKTKHKGLPDHVDEKWSEKYKRSINCNNPKGFSQKAHCAGRNK